MMKKLLPGIVLGTLLVAGHATAQCNDDPNEIGIFWSEQCGSCETCMISVTQVVSAYVVLANATQDSVSGYEFRLVNGDGSPFAPPPNTFVLGYTLPGPGINIAPQPDFIVGLSTPLPWASCMTLLQIDFFAGAPEPWCFGLTFTEPASIPGEMAYADGADPGLLIPMRPNIGAASDGFAMACLNYADCPTGPVAIENQIWGNVKSLYR